MPNHSGPRADERQEAAPEHAGPRGRTASDGERPRTLHPSRPLPRGARHPHAQAEECDRGRSVLNHDTHVIDTVPYLQG